MEEEDILIVVLEANGRQIVGWIGSELLGEDGYPNIKEPLLLDKPLALIEQHIGNGKVNVAIVPVMASVVVQEILVNATSCVLVPPRSQLEERYNTEWERHTTALRAAHAGIVMAGAGQMPKPGQVDGPTARR